MSCLARTVEGPTRKLGYVSRRRPVTVSPRTESPKCSNLGGGGLASRSLRQWNSLFVVGTGVVGMIFKDVVWAGVKATVGKYLCSDVVVEDGGERRKGVLICEDGAEGSRRAGGHVEVWVGEPVGHGVVDIRDRTSKRTGENSGGYKFCAGSNRDGAEGKDVLDRHDYKYLEVTELAGHSSPDPPPLLHSVADSETPTQTITISAGTVEYHHDRY